MCGITALSRALSIRVAECWHNSSSYRAHVSITANLIICQCAGLKSIPVFFHLNIIWKNNPSESRPMWHQVWCGASLHIHVHHHTWGEMLISMSQKRYMPHLSQMYSWLFIDYSFYENPCDLQRDLPQSSVTSSPTALLQVILKPFQLKKTHLGQVLPANVPPSTFFCDS